jgi:hypothetical protein
MVLANGKARISNTYRSYSPHIPLFANCSGNTTENISTMEGSYDSRKGRLTTFWEEKRVIFICFLIGFAQFQYGYDSAAVAGFQSMAGFLRIFGYPDVS